jgi:hypothetical protein
MRPCLYYIAAVFAAALFLQNRAVAQAPQASYDPLRHGHALLIGNSQYRDVGWAVLDDIPLQLRALESGLKNHFDDVEVVQNLTTRAPSDPPPNLTPDIVNLYWRSRHGTSSPLGEQTNGFPRTARSRSFFLQPLTVKPTFTGTE